MEHYVNTDEWDMWGFEYKQVTVVLRLCFFFLKGQSDY